MIKIRRSKKEDFLLKIKAVRSPCYTFTLSDSSKLLSDRLLNLSFIENIYLLND